MIRRIILMSDIHGNLPALEAVVESLPEHDDVFIAGDHCLEGPSPDGVLDLLVDRGWSLIMGNTDRDIVEPPADVKATKAARIVWTRTKLGADRLAVLSGLPFSARVNEEDSNRLLVVHANPRTMDDHLRPTMSAEELQPYLDGVDAEVLAFGHLHTPYVRPVRGILLVDVSSVGHPKDLDHRAAFTVLTWENGRRSVEQVRVPYNLDRTIDMLRRSDMPGAEEQIAALLKASY